ncbi:MAG: glycoside hydrolase family 65 protein [Jiangellaceae bacterium]|nr:glycoside hydrolase family 65 protein [Jiangellaceae bacterium]
MTDRTFEALIFDWDGTAVPDRKADATAVRSRLEALCRAGVHVFVVSGTHVGNVDGQLGARPDGTGRLFLCLNRGSEVFEVQPAGPALVYRREATDDEEHGLDRAAALTIERLRAKGVSADVVTERLNRRKIDVIPEPEWSDPPKARIGGLLDAVTARLRAAGVTDIGEVVRIAAAAAADAGLAGARITSDVKHVEIGLTDKGDSARWAAHWLASRGITGGLVLVSGDEFGPVGGVVGSDSLMVVPELARAVVVTVGAEPGGVQDGIIQLSGGPNRFLEVLDAQLDRRDARRVPWMDEDPRWVLHLPEGAGTERTAEALGALCNGCAGVRGDGGGGHAQLFVVNGVYSDGDNPRLLPGPLWTALAVEPGQRDEHQQVDLRTGLLGRHEDTGLRAVRFVSMADPHALGVRAEGSAQDLQRIDGLGHPGAPDVSFEHTHQADAELARTTTADGVGIVVAARDREQVRDSRRVVERLAAWTAGPAPDWNDALERLSRIDRAGFDRLLAEHRAAWAERWQDAEVSIEGNADDELAARFAVFHLLSAAPGEGEAAVGARGLTGPAYGGHVFWDADVFVLPALAAIRPAAARSMLEYRMRRLTAARELATKRRRSGARFPWESAGDGSDVTPSLVPGRDGSPIQVRTGTHQVHIVADIAWAAVQYAAWTGDTAFLTGPGRDLVLDTARYWASRARYGPDGRAHLYGVMGPDEYHQVVDDNAYTNVMARWHLRRAAGIAEATGGDRAEGAAWRQLADALVDGLHPARGGYEQFAGYDDLEPLLVRDIAQRPVAADLLLGEDRLVGSQVIKQADVVMLHHLLPDEVAPGSLIADLDYYEPRTAHGSSLSPAIYAAVLARAGRPEEALELFRVAARLDLDDITGTTAGGLHLATFGGVWQALAYGFLGLRTHDDVLDVDPRLPSAWQALGLRLRFRGARIGVRADSDAVAISCSEPCFVRVAGGDRVRCDPPGRSFPWGADDEDGASRAGR